MLRITYHSVCCCFTVGRRVGLFDGLSQCRSDDSAHQESDKNSTGPLQTLPLLIPAKHLAVISAMRSSPPPDLGLPIASADDGPAADPNGPPVLEPELDHTADGSSDSATAEAPETVADCAASLTVAPPSASDNGVIIIE